MVFLANRAFASTLKTLCQEGKIFIWLLETKKKQKKHPVLNASYDCIVDLFIFVCGWIVESNQNDALCL